jgi:ribosomal protein S18 acetylase RimI-like enzyme
MEINTANIEDAEQILNLQKLAYQSEAAIYQDFGIPPLTQTIENMRGQFEDHTFLKAIDGKNIIGSVRAYSESVSCFIGRLIVHPEWQRKGIGTRLMNEIEVQFPKVLRYELFTGTKSESNIGLYKKLEYKTFKKEVVDESHSLFFWRRNVL